MVHWYNPRIHHAFRVVKVPPIHHANAKRYCQVSWPLEAVFNPISSNIQVGGSRSCLSPYTCKTHSCFERKIELLTGRLRGNHVIDTVSTTVVTAHRKVYILSTVSLKVVRKISGSHPCRDWNIPEVVYEYFRLDYQRWDLGFCFSSFNLCTWPPSLWATRLVTTFHSIFSCSQDIGFSFTIAHSPSLRMPETPLS